MDNRSLSPYVFRPIPDGVDDPGLGQAGSGSGTRSRVCSGDRFDRFSSQAVSSPTSRIVNPKLLTCYKLSQETWSSTGSRHSSRPGKKKQLCDWLDKVRLAKIGVCHSNLKSQRLFYFDLTRLIDES